MDQRSTVSRPYHLPYRFWASSWEPRLRQHEQAVDEGWSLGSRVALASTVRVLVGLADQENISEHQFCPDLNIPKNLLAVDKYFLELSKVDLEMVGEEFWNEIQ